VNTILWANFAPDGNEIYLDNSVIDATYSDIQGGWSGEGNIDADPLFVDPDNGDYHLQEGSPCIDAGDPNSPLDPDGTIADIGAFYFDQTGCVADVEIVPDDDPVEVPAGGSFGLTGTIGSPCDTTITTDVWYGAEYNNHFYEQGHFNNIPLDPDEYVNAHLVQDVPVYVPAGTYQYCAYCGYHPNVILDSSCFPFTVTTGRIDSGVNEWYCEGGFGTDNNEIPSEYTLTDSYPNPFNAQTSISFDVPTASKVSLEVYNIMGQKVATLVNGNVEAGTHTVFWDAGDYSSGIYFYKLTAGDKVFTKRMTLLK